LTMLLNDTQPPLLMNHGGDKNQMPILDSDIF
jgi:hypothetical protein